MKSIHVPTDAPVAEPDPVAQQWCANVAHLMRKKYFFIVDARTLVAVMLPGKGITTAEDFLSAASAAIERYFTSRGWDRLLGTRFNIDANDPVILETDDAAVLGAMNDLVYQARFAMEYHDRSVDVAIEHMNDNPLKALGWNKPNEVVERLLENL